MIKLFVTDIDGTLMPAGGRVSEKNIAAVQAMRRAGIEVAIATGRMYRAALPVAAQLKVPVPIIAYNGALIKSSAGEVLHTRYLDAPDALRLMNFFEECGWHLQSYVDDVLYVPERNDCAKYYEDAQKVEAVEVGWSGLRERVEGITKLLSIADTPDETAARLAELESIFGGQVEVTRSAPRFVEFMARGVSKASAIKILADKLNVDTAQVMAIGDSDNDLAMLTGVGVGVAMGNAVPAVKAACKLITDTCDNDGFAAAVYDYALSSPPFN